MKMKLFDAHCHLQDPRVIDKAPVLIATALATGVLRFAVNGTAEKDWESVKEMGEIYPSVIPCFGLHPWFIADRSPNWFDTLKGYFETTPCAAVGEIGVDKGPLATTDFADQVEVCKKQLELAKELNRPVTVHCVQAHAELLEIMKSIGPFPAGVILHSYIGSAEFVPEFAKLNSYFSISAWLMYNYEDPEAKKILQAVPSDRLLLETDAPDALPKPGYGTIYPVPGDTSGKLNQPANINCVLGYVSSLLEMEEEEVAKLSYENAARLFSYEGSKIVDEYSK